MRRLLTSLALGIILAASLFSGCVTTVETYEDPGRAIEIELGQEFIIALGSNPTTGYGWEASYDGKNLRLVEVSYGTGGKRRGAGAGGIEFFRFKTLKAGESSITMTYKRPWEEKPTTQKSFTVLVR